MDLQETEAGETAQDDIDSYVTRWSCWPGIKRLLEGKATLKEAAEYAQAHEPEAKARKLEVLMRNMGRVRAHLIKTEAEAKLAELQGKVAELQTNADGSAKKTLGYVDVLESLAELLDTQMQRIREGRAIEGKVKYLLRDMTSNIAEAREILKFTFEVQEQLGIAKKKPAELDTRSTALTFEQRQRVGRLLTLVRDKVEAETKEAEIVLNAAQQAIDTDLATPARNNVVQIDGDKSRQTHVMDTKDALLDMEPDVVDIEEVQGKEAEKPWED